MHSRRRWNTCDGSIVWRKPGRIIPEQKNGIFIKLPNCGFGPGNFNLFQNINVKIRNWYLKLHYVIGSNYWCCFPMGWIGTWLNSLYTFAIMQQIKIWWFWRRFWNSGRFCIFTRIFFLQTITSNKKSCWKQLPVPSNQSKKCSWKGIRPIEEKISCFKIRFEFYYIWSIKQNM